MSLKLYYDPYDVNCFRGEPTTNLCYISTPVYGDYTSYFPQTSSYQPIWAPNGRQTVAVVRYLNNNQAGACCPRFFEFSTGSNGIPVSPNTTYCYSVFYKILNPYSSANFLYRYEYTAPAGSYVTEGGVFSDTNRIAYPGGWYRAWGTFTTSGTTNVLLWTGAFTYEYNTQNTQYFVNPQIEAKNHLTNYAGPSGVRGATVPTGGGLIDLSGGGCHGDLTYTDFTSSTVPHNNTLYFRGSGTGSDKNCIRILYPQTNPSLLANSASFSIVVWAKKNAGTTDTPYLFSYYNSGFSEYVSLFLHGTGSINSTFGFLVAGVGGTAALQSPFGTVNATK